MYTLFCLVAMLSVRKDYEYRISHHSSWIDCRNTIAEIYPDFDEKFVTQIACVLFVLDSCFINVPEKDCQQMKLLLEKEIELARERKHAYEPKIKVDKTQFLRKNMTKRFDAWNIEKLYAVQMLIDLLQSDPNTLAQCKQTVQTMYNLIELGAHSYAFTSARIDHLAQKANSMCPQIKQSGDAMEAKLAELRQVIDQGNQFLKGLAGATMGPAVTAAAAAPAAAAASAAAAPAASAAAAAAVWPK